MAESNPATWVDDTLPPEAIYPTRQSVLSAINDWAKPRGYAFTTGKSTKTSNGRVKVVFACDRNGRPKASSERKRQTCSRKIGCEFSVLAKESWNGTAWELVHRGSAYSQHNHLPSSEASAHPTHRQLQDEERAMISDLTVAGAAPQQIRTYLSNNSSNTLATQ